MRLHDRFEAYHLQTNAYMTLQKQCQAIASSLLPVAYLGAAWLQLHPALERGLPPAPLQEDAVAPRTCTV